MMIKKTLYIGKSKTHLVLPRPWNSFIHGHYHDAPFSPADTRKRKSSIMLHLLVGSHADGVVAAVESDELGLEHDISVDLEAAVDGLETAETGCNSLLAMDSHLDCVKKGSTYSDQWHQRPRS